MQRHVEHKHSARKPPRKQKESRDRRDTIPVAPRTDTNDKQPGDGREPEGQKMEGEGSYTAGRRYDEAAQEFAQSGEVEPSARQAADELNDDELLDGGPSIDEEGEEGDTRPGYHH